MNPDELSGTIYHIGVQNSVLKNQLSELRPFLRSPFLSVPNAWQSKSTSHGYRSVEVFSNPSKDPTDVRNTYPRNPQEPAASLALFNLIDP